MTEFKDLFNIKSELIDTYVSWNNVSQISYAVGWSLNQPYKHGIDLIRLNANEKLYNQFLEENFFKPFSELLNSDELARMFYPSFYIDEDLDGNRILTINYISIMDQLLRSLSYAKVDSDKYPTSIDEEIQTLKQALKEERNVYYDIKNNGKNSKYYEIEFNDFENSKRNKANISFEKYIDNRINYYNKFIMACRNIKSLFLKELDIEKLAACVNYDKFCLTVARSFLEIMEFMDKIKNKINPCYVYIESYLDAVEEYRKTNKNYNCKIKCFDSKENKIYSYSIDDLIREYSGIMSKHPEANITPVSIDEALSRLIDSGFDMASIDTLTKKEYTKLLQNIAYGIKVKDVSEEDYEKNINNYKKQIKETEDQDIKNKLQQQISKMEFLKNNEPVKIIKGYGSFDNYYGYVYSNGYVVLDVILDDVNKSYGHAIYIMPYNKLIEYSEEKKKTNIKSKIDVIPIPHRGNWEERLLEKMNSLEKLPLELDEPSIELKSIVNPETLRLLLEQLSNISKNPSEEIKQRIAESVVIDEELKNSEPAAELTKSEEEQLSNIEFELLEESKGQEDFFKLHKLAKQKEIKVKRNPEVSLKTKLRTKDKDGFYHCDLCDSAEQKGNNNSIGKSIRMFESHHIVPISDGGIDNIYNTCCLCPNCHTRIHNYLKLQEKIKKGIPVDEGALNEFMTMAEYGSFLKKVRERIASSTPEYLSKFDELFNPNYKNDKGLTDKELEELYKQEEEYYKNNKEQEDAKFLTDWNTPLKK